MERSAAAYFCSLLLASLVIGAMFGIWLSFNPAGLGAAAYVMQQQHGIRTLNGTMPVLGALTILLTIAAAALAHNDGTRFALLMGATTCFVAVALITRFLNQPINAIMIGWSPDSPPANWTQLRDAWWRWLVVRLAVGIGGLCLLIIAMLKHASS
jgi:uncharacterized membrane protein